MSQKDDLRLAVSSLMSKKRPGKWTRPSPWSSRVGDHLKSPSLMIDVEIIGIHFTSEHFMDFIIETKTKTGETIGITAKSVQLWRNVKKTANSTTWYEFEVDKYIKTYGSNRLAKSLIKQIRAYQKRLNDKIDPPLPF